MWQDDLFFFTEEFVSEMYEQSHNYNFDNNPVV